MKENTKEEKAALLREMTKDAKRLCRQDAEAMGYTYNQYPYGFRFWLSTEDKTCYYCNTKIPMDYHIYKKPNVWNLIHFLPENCKYVCANKGLLAKCLCTTREGNVYRYFYDEHEVGKCPHKKPF